MKKDGGVQYRISGSFGDSAIPLLLDFFLLEGSTTAHDGSTTEEGALYSTSGDELQQPGATGGTVRTLLLLRSRQVLWVVIHRHQQRRLEVNSPLSNAVPRKNEMTMGEKMPRYWPAIGLGAVNIIWLRCQGFRPKFSPGIQELLGSGSRQGSCREALCNAF